MGPPLVEDFSDVAAFVQEDTSYVEQSASDDELERKIAEEHAKFKEALARRQEEVRASRPWSAPPVESPRPEQQKERERERHARGSNDAVDLAAPRAEYEPPVRPYLLQAQASGSNVSYLSRPQSAEHRAAATTRNVANHPARVSLSGIEEETGEATACDSRQASEMGRLNSTFGEGASASAGAEDDMSTRDQLGLSGLVKEEEEEGEGGLPRQEATIAEEPEEEEAYGEEEGDGRAGPHKQDDDEESEERDVDTRLQEPSAQEVGEDDGGALDGNAPGGGGAAEAEDEDGERAATGSGELAESGGEDDGEEVYDGVLLASAVGLGSPRGGQDRLGRVSPRASSGSGAWGARVTGSKAGVHREGDGEGEGSGQEGGGERHGQSAVGAGGQGEEAPSSARGAPSIAASSTATQSMAMRGFVEPLPYETSYGVVSPAPARKPATPQSTKAGGSGGAGEEEEEDYGGDTFEDEETETEEREDLRHPLSGERSFLRPSPSASRALLSSSIRSRAGSSSAAPPSGEPSRALSAAPALSPPASASASAPLPPARERSTGTGVEDAELPSASAPPAALPPIYRLDVGGGSGCSATEAPPPQLSGRPPLASGHSQRSFSGTGIPLPAALQPPAPLSELQPSQQFALQLLKHDIEELPQHHRAAAEAAAAARRKSATTRPAGAGLAAFGYLGYHMVSEELTAPSGPGFRSGSPGRAASPGRGESGSSGLAGNASLKAARLSGPPDLAAAAGGRSGRPTSAPHMRPSVGNIDENASGGAAGMDTAAAESGAGFVGLARELRAGRLLPPVVPLTANRVGRADSGSGVKPAGAEGTAVQHDHSVSMMAESELTAAVAQSRIKFDVWLDALSSGNPPHGAGGSAGPGSNISGSGMMETEQRVPYGGAAGMRVGGGAGGGGGGRGPQRPMTAPASGRRRPNSARPMGGAGGGGGYRPPPAVVNIPKPLTRPLSAQPHHHVRPTSASLVRNGGGGGGAVSHFDGGADPPVSVTVPSGDTAAAGGTAAVEVGGLTVSVYVADTLKRIVEANRWLQQLGVTSKRYRLKDRFSNMTIQLVEELPPLQSERAGGGPPDGGSVIVKELTLKQFLSGHAKLKQQAKKLRQAAAMAAATAAAQQQQPAGGGGGGGGVYGMAEFGIGGGGGSSRATHVRPSSASFVSSGAMVGPNSSRMRPASAMPYSSSRVAGGTDSAMYGGGVGPGSGPGLQPGRPSVRPNSANPAYGRTPPFISYNSGTSPPAVPSSPFMHSTAYAANAAGSSGGAAPAARLSGASGATAGFPQPRAAWGSPGGGGSGYPSYQGYPAAAGRSTVVGAGSGLPYMHQTISTTAARNADLDAEPHARLHLEDDNDSEQEMIIEPDERGDVSRAVRQQLGSAADYCQARRREIGRLRTLPLA